METVLQNWSVLLVIALILGLLLFRTTMLGASALAALVAIVASGSQARSIIAEAAPGMANVWLVMTAVQLSVLKILEGGAGERLSLLIATAFAARKVQSVPAGVLVPIMFVPMAMLLAGAFHNITAILIVAPLLIDLASRFRVNPTWTIYAILIASNLGGASCAFADAPAIVQRELWHFSPATFMLAMLPRNLIILFFLTGITCILTWYPNRRIQTSWIDVLDRLMTSDRYQKASFGSSRTSFATYLGYFSLAAFILLQFVFPTESLLTSSAVLATLLAFTPGQKRLNALMCLGAEPILIIFSLFVLSHAVQQAPLVHQLGGFLADHRGAGAIEVIAYLLTTGISADGAAVTLAPLIHTISGGSMFSAWQLACGICAGSSSLLTAASAGPILSSVSEKSGFTFTFRDYARFGLTFSLVMLGLYTAMNFIASGR